MATYTARAACGTNRPDVKGGDLQIARLGIGTLALALFIAAAPLDLDQLSFVLCGAFAYALWQAFPRLLGLTRSAPPARSSRGQGKEVLPRPGPPWSGGGGGPAPEKVISGPAGQERRLQQSSVRPVAPPAFAPGLLEDQVSELLGQISPKPACRRVVERLAWKVEQVLACVFPGAEVAGFVNGDIARGTAFAVSVPEVDIVLSASPQVLAAHLRAHGQLARGGPTAALFDVRRLQKAVLRSCCERLLSEGGFRFRRSAFRSMEPQVILLAPPLPGMFDKAVPCSFSVNTTMPLYNSALFAACRRMEPRAGELILLVRRWAKDRGICYAAKGYLPPYAWTLLVVYFLQQEAAAAAWGGPPLPPLGGVLPQGLKGQQHPRLAAAALAGGLFLRGPRLHVAAPAARHAGVSTAAVLLGRFAGFYSHDFDWCNEAASPRLGRRGPPRPELTMHVLFPDAAGGAVETGPSVEDPFEPQRNLGTCASAAGMERTRWELARAEALCLRGAPLSELLAPWAPLPLSEQ